MTPLAEMIPAMSDADLATLRANAARLVESGDSNRVMAASDILPVIDSEVARRAALPNPENAAPKRAPARKKLQPVTGHQTALPARA